jgi:hypothetical protein
MTFNRMIALESPNAQVDLVTMDSQPSLHRSLSRITWVGLLAGLAWGFPVAAQGTTNWTSLFDGHSTSAWRGFRLATFPTNCWVIDRGALKTVPDHEVDLVTRESYRDFELELEWKVAVASNSGILFHVSEDGDQTWLSGPEMQVVDDDNTDDGKEPLTSAGALYDLVAPKGKRLKPAGQWNLAKVLVQGHHVEHWLNGVKLLEYELGSPELNALIAKTKFKDMPNFGKNEAGLIALQNHGGEVWYRNIRIRRL